MRALADARGNHGMRLSIEAYGGPCDTRPMRARRRAMAESGSAAAFPYAKEMASAAHTYGKPILGAEAFTADNNERCCSNPPR